MRIPAVITAFGFAWASIVPARCQSDARCPSTAYDRPAKLLSSMEPFKKAVRSEEYAGRVVFRLAVDENGNTHDLKITFPAKLAANSKIIGEINAWRFCPAVKLSRGEPSAVEFNIDFREP
jgi:hypothetical protein